MITESSSLAHGGEHLKVRSHRRRRPIQVVAAFQHTDQSVLAQIVGHLGNLCRKTGESLLG